MKVIIDRFEGDIAVIEISERKFVNMPRQLLPAEAGEGSVISIEVDTDETRKRQEKIAGLIKDIWKD